MKSCQIQVTKKEKEEETHQAFFFLFFFLSTHQAITTTSYIHIFYSYTFAISFGFFSFFNKKIQETKKKKKGKFILVCLKTLWNLLQWVALDLLRPKPMVILKLLLFLSGFSGICSKFWYYLKKNVSECYCKK